jgi:hypothetical protein
MEFRITLPVASETDVGETLGVSHALSNVGAAYGVAHDEMNSVGVTLGVAHEEKTIAQGA